MRADTITADGDTICVVMRGNTREELAEDRPFVNAAKLAAFSQLGVKAGGISRIMGPVPESDRGDSMQDMINSPEKITSWSRTVHLQAASE